MSNYIIKVEHLGKKYIIDHQGREGYTALRDVIVNKFKGILAKSSKTDNFKEAFWALQDMSFEVQEGDRVGIVGNNGAGKSTLLKALSRIIEPSTGRIHIKGRMASLLEVGTGFHPELTGRENVFLNGAILGMSRYEIRKKFDEIIAFSGVEKFLDTPVKRYSSGMYVRLAFAVAAHLESEILVIDEVLAVGDMEFQKKCLGKMEDVSKSGRTILFVSHNMGAVESLCNKGLFVKKGRLVAAGQSKEVINHYLSDSLTAMELKSGIIERPRNADKLIQKIELLANGVTTDSVPMGARFQINVYFRSTTPLQYPVLGIIIKDPFNTPLLGVNNKNYVGNVSPAALNEGVISMTIPYLQLMAGHYAIDIHFGDGHRDLDVWKEACSMRVEQMKFAAGEFPNESLNKFFVPDIEWKLESPNYSSETK